MKNANPFMQSRAENSKLIVPCVWQDERDEEIDLLREELEEAKEAVAEGKECVAMCDVEIKALRVPPPSLPPLRSAPSLRSTPPRPPPLGRGSAPAQALPAQAEVKLLQAAAPADAAVAAAAAAAGGDELDTIFAPARAVRPPRRHHACFHDGFHEARHGGGPRQRPDVPLQCKVGCSIKSIHI